MGQCFIGLSLFILCWVFGIGLIIVNHTNSFLYNVHFYGEGLIEIRYCQNRCGDRRLLKSRKGYSGFLVPSELPFLEKVGKKSSDDAIILNKFPIISYRA